MDKAGIALIAAAVGIAVLVLLSTAGFPEALGIALIDLLRVAGDWAVRRGRGARSPASEPDHRSGGRCPGGIC
ncbi:hypothetical protein ACFP1Z_03760 [Streptomyces gamaensis]|uniref:Uncharacterized protein n=1 Tax=Streptomyces gamaensis TaxID=1763542 RepID=A0ABW0YUY1_9ACTN